MCVLNSVGLSCTEYSQKYSGQIVQYMMPSCTIHGVSNIIVTYTIS